MEKRNGGGTSGPNIAQSEQERPHQSLAWREEPKFLEIKITDQAADNLVDEFLGPINTDRAKS
ncbi:hypothetical protein scyTo_0027413, partial [Scyliorhinus torazame]|nr:hypothetical protein [Scyliorhinus torazame]